jgi:hypothetical protein
LAFASRVANIHLRYSAGQAEYAIGQRMAPAYRAVCRLDAPTDAPTEVADLTSEHEVI